MSISSLSLRGVAAVIGAALFVLPALAQNVTRTRLFAAPSHTFVGKSVTLRADVDALGGGAVTGQVTFNEGATQLGAATLSAAGAGQETVTAGGYHSCALSSAGGVKCWGSNYAGQLGDNTLDSHLYAKPVPALSSGVVSISAGTDYTCAVTAAGGAKCWGTNYYGALGAGSSNRQLEPTDVVGLTSGVVSIAAGHVHSCALMATGIVKCWGANNRGQLGDGTTNASNTPVTVVGLKRIVAISVGGGQSCALHVSGSVLCWGMFPGNGALSSPLPVRVPGLGDGVRAVSIGGHICVVTGVGGVKCWGDNSVGQIGNVATQIHLTPVQIPGLESGIVAVSAGAGHSCALSGAGGVKCWGERAYGKLGDGSAGPFFSYAPPVQVADLTTGVVAVAAGRSHSCASLVDGSVKCWGNNRDGQLGDGTASFIPRPVFVSGLSSGVVAVNAGGAHACALKAGGVRCWGANSSGQLGDGSIFSRTTPVAVQGLPSDVVAVAAGGEHSCARTSAGGVSCWGRNFAGEIGDGTKNQRNTPVAVSGLGDVVSLALGGVHSCALNSGGGVKCWGSNYKGQIGDNVEYGERLTPVYVYGLRSGVSAVVAGYEHSCALTTAGAVKCWGANYYGQMGDGGPLFNNQIKPYSVPGLSSGVVALAAGRDHTCALTNAGAVKCWGANEYGQIGNGATSLRQTLVTPLGLDAGVVAIAAGNYHSCAMMNTGDVKCWGANSVGQLGDLTTINRLTPTRIASPSGEIVALELGGKFSCAVTSAGAAKCWGDNVGGQVGSGTPLQRLAPVTTRNLLSLVRARAQFTTSFSNAGLHTLHGTYDGDATHLPSMGVTTQLVFQ